ncbi:pyridoxamine 5'-phosphate oxidase family protein [Streptomyces lunaelactis]|nr:pyridoxamine 5'-phosphate oxidase family protein [Streptomyces lunaelactis]NUK11666.1 pyridoxamine 5'-phosphate oxidase family protein [Streptomyces lunaelactis]NUK19328.1 pyridoxamine 5'-phosphate oxidase family protein [Streptomyces lunaelactis]NUK26220.1 pyridoxamine 5'-phosphate oxidase family protein [Streptomyces lunaelactis]NUK34883.1 pyridoxamine 5'-phosphate oxidase family protein [Streptomyces lunaelactis]
MVEVSGTEALWLLEGAAQGRLVYIQRESSVIRPAVHLLQYGRLIVRTPAQATALSDRATLTYHADEIRVAGGTGWTVTATGPAEVITDADEAAHYRRTLPGWVHGPHDTLLRIRPQAVTGFRLAHEQA